MANNFQVGVAATGSHRESARPRGAEHVVLLVISVLVSAVSLYRILQPVNLHSNWDLYVSITCLIWLGTYLFTTYNQFKTFYLFTSAYVVALCLFHLGVTIPSGIGWYTTPRWGDDSFVPWLEQAGWYTALSLGSIGIGFSLSISQHSFMSHRFHAPIDLVSVRKETLFWIGIGMFIAVLCFVAMMFSTGGNIFSYSRTEWFAGVGAGSSRGLGLFLWVLPGAITLLVIGARNRKEKIFSSMLATFGFTLILLSGYRSSALFPLMIGVILWVKVGNRIPLVISAGVMVFILIAIPVIGQLRALGTYEELGAEQLSIAIKSSSVQQGVAELGGTAIVLAEILRLVPDKDPYRNGSSYVLALKNSIPNLGLEKGVSPRQQARKKGMLNPDVYNELAPSDWLTYRILKDRFDIGGGTGFSAIGEPYLNFGLTGVVCFFIPLGYLLGKLDQVNLFNHPKLMIFCAAILWTLIRTVRNDFSNFIKPMVFITIILLIWIVFSKIFRPQKLRGLIK